MFAEVMALAVRTVIQYFLFRMNFQDETEKRRK